MLTADYERMCTEAARITDGAHKSLTIGYLRCCAELCLSPAARAKMGLMAAQGKADADDPLATAMNGGADK